MAEYEREDFDRFFGEVFGEVFGGDTLASRLFFRDGGVWGGEAPPAKLGGSGGALPPQLNLVMAEYVFLGKYVFRKVLNIPITS